MTRARERVNFSKPEKEQILRDMKHYLHMETAMASPAEATVILIQYDGLMKKIERWCSTGRARYN